MAIKVVEHGNKRFRTTCYICGCKFEYDWTDVEDLHESPKIHCPDCGHTLAHSLGNDIAFQEEVKRNTVYTDIPGFSICTCDGVKVKDILGR